MPFSSADPAAFLGVGIQSGLAAPQTTASKFRFAKYLSGTEYNPTIDVVDIREGGDGLDFGFTYKNMQVARGQIQIAGRPDVIGQLLALVPGGATWLGASAPAGHQFHTSHASHPWSTLQIGHPATSIVHFVQDVKFTGVTIAGGGGDKRILFTFPFVGVHMGASSVVLTPTYLGEAPWLYHNSPTYLLDGALSTTMESWEIAMGLGIDELQAQSVTLDDISVLNRDTNVTFTQRYEDPTLWKKVYYNGGVAPTTAVATGSLDVMVGYDSAAAIRTLRAVTPLLSYRGDVLTQLDPDGQTVKETVTGKALKGATHAFFALLQNAHASAYGS